MKNAKFTFYVNLMIVAAILVLLVQNPEVVYKAITTFFGILAPFIIGGAVAFVVNIPMSAFEKNVFKNVKKGKRILSLIFAILSILIVLAIVILMVIPQLVTTISELTVKIPEFLKNTYYDLNLEFQENPQILELLEKLNFKNFEWTEFIHKIEEFLTSGASSEIGNFLGKTFSAVGTFFGGIVDSLIAFIFSIYILTQKEKLNSQMHRVLKTFLKPSHYERLNHLLVILNKNFTSYIRSQCLEAFILGCIFLIVLSIFRMPYALLISVLIMVCALIPVVGAFVGCFVGAFLILVESPVKMIVFVILFLIIQACENNFIYPKVVGHSVNLPAIWVLMAVSVGGGLFGVIGMLIFIPVASTIYSLIKEKVEQNENESKEISIEKTES